MTTLSNILQSGKIKKIENEKVFNCLNKSISSEFYSKHYAVNPEKEKPELYDALKAKHQEEGSAYKIMEEIVGFLEKEMKPGSVVVEIAGGIYQTRSANAYKRFENYVPLDISETNMMRYSEKYNLPSIIADSKSLPFKDNSVDCIFTHTFLEHPMEPEDSLKEIARVLKPGGIVVHNDAWFCRWWHRFAIVGLKKFNHMTAKEKIIWMTAKLTEFPILRIPPIIIKRIFRLLPAGTQKNIKLKYKKLTPNYDLNLGCDEDAANSIDPVDVIKFYESRNFSLLKALSLKQRLFYPNKYIVLKKKT